MTEILSWLYPLKGKDIKTSCCTHQRGNCENFHFGAPSFKLVIGSWSRICKSNQQKKSCNDKHAWRSVRNEAGLHETTQNVLQGVHMAAL